MSFILFERFTKLSLLRAVFWLIMGISLLLMPDFLLGGLFYVLIGYLIVNALLHIFFFACETTAGDTQHQLDLVATADIPSKLLCEGFGSMFRVRHLRYSV